MMKSGTMGKEDEGVIEYCLSFKLLAAFSSIGASVCSTYFIIGTGMPSTMQQIGYLLLMLTVEAVAVFMVIGVFRSKYFLDESGITKRVALFKPSHINWNDIQCISYDEEKGFFVKGPKKKFRFEKFRSNLPFFAFMVKKYVDGYKYIEIEKRIDSLSNQHLGLTSIISQEGRRKNSIYDYGKFLASFVAFLAAIAFSSNASGTDYIALAVMIASIVISILLDHVSKRKSKGRAS